MSEKNRDDKNRWRNVTIAFRMSPEENKELNNRVKLSGFRTQNLLRISLHLDLRSRELIIVSTAQMNLFSYPVW